MIAAAARKPIPVGCEVAETESRIAAPTSPRRSSRSSDRIAPSPVAIASREGILSPVSSSSPPDPKKRIRIVGARARRGPIRRRASA